MTNLDQRIGAWSGVVSAAVLGAGLLIAGFVPPPSPTLGAQELAALYQANAASIRFGVLLGIVSIAFYLPFIATISSQMRRMRHDSAMPIYLQLGAGSVGSLLLLLPIMMFGVVVFRPDRDPQATLILSDTAWLFFITPFPTFIAQNVGIALGIFGDKSAQPVFPRWVAYFNIWIGLLFIPAGLAFFLKTGPFAWNGLLSFWLAAVAFFSWILVMVFMLLQAIRSAHGSLSPDGDARSESLRGALAK